MKSSSLTSARRKLHYFFWILLCIGFVTISFLIYKELSAPLPNQPIVVSTEAPPAVEPKDPIIKAAYAVPPDRPRQLIIPRLGIDANIYPVGLVDGTIGAPTNAWDVGWYSSSALPGKPGSLLLDGHVNDALNSPGIFAKLHTLQQTDEIRVERGDKTVLHYRVNEVRQVPLKDVDMRLLLDAKPGEERTVLITCGGTYDMTRQTYNDRVIVIAYRKS